MLRIVGKVEASGEEASDIQNVIDAATEFASLSSVVDSNQKGLFVASAWTHVEAR